MSTKQRTITGWVLSGIIGLMMVASALDKIAGSAHARQMGSSFGLSGRIYSLLGGIELVSVLLFVYPRTGILGTLLLSSYLGGAIATHLQHQQNISFPMAIEAAVWITALIRFPELQRRIMTHKSVNDQVQ